MSSLIFDSALDDEARGNINYASDTFYALLVTSAYTPNKGTHTKRSDVTGELTGGVGGYVAGGFAATISLSKDTVGHKEVITLGGISVSSATITARGLVYYKHRGGLASADELVAYIDFGADVTSTAATWAATASTMNKNNP